MHVETIKCQYRIILERAKNHTGCVQIRLAETTLFNCS